MSKIIHSIITPISEHGNELLSKATVLVGVSGSSVGVVSGVNDVVTTGNTLMSSQSTIGVVCGVGGFVVLLIKAAVDIYFARKKDKREQEIHIQSRLEQSVRNRTKK